MSTGLKVDANLSAQNQQQQQQNNQTSNIQLQTQNRNNKNSQVSEQQQDDVVDYKIDKLLPKQNQKQKLIQQNIKLKTQIYQLAVQLDQILMKDKMKRKKYGISIEDQDQAIKAKRLQLKKQQLQIVQAKNKIFQLKRQLDSVFNNQIVQEQQDKLKHIKKLLQEVEDQKNGLVKIKKGQAKAIKSIKNQQQFRDKIDKTHKQVIKVKQQTQKLKQKALQARKDQVNCHDKYVMKKQKIRQLQSKLAQNAKGMKQKQKNNKNMLATNTNNNNQNANNKDMISNELLAELQQQIKKLQIQKKQGQKMWQDKIRTIEIQIQFKRQQEQRKLLMLRQKQKQLKLNEIRIRQLRKLIKQNIIQQNTKKTQDMDMSQFRHKRNIRYIQK